MTTTPSPTERLLGPHAPAARPSRRTPRAQRREQRIARSQKRQQDHIRDKANAAATPLDLYEVAYSTLRTRLVQTIRKAEDAVARATEAEDAKRLEQANRRLASARSQVEQVCDQVIAYLEKKADGFDTARR